jgi:hypothetical protein
MGSPNLRRKKAAMAGFSDDQIHDLLRNADRLGFGVRPEGFVLINRARLIEDHAISKSDAQLMDEWVAGVGGSVQALQRQTPEEARKHYQAGRKRPDTIVWGIPADALKAPVARAH